LSAEQLRAREQSWPVSRSTSQRFGNIALGSFEVALSKVIFGFLIEFYRSPIPSTDRDWDGLAGKACYRTEQKKNQNPGEGAHTDFCTTAGDFCKIDIRCRSQRKSRGRSTPQGFSETN
jgi:hypothetical protein